MLRSIRPRHRRRAAVPRPGQRRCGCLRCSAALPRQGDRAQGHRGLRHDRGHHRDGAQRGQRQQAGREPVRPLVDHQGRRWRRPEHRAVQDGQAWPRLHPADHRQGARRSPGRGLRIRRGRSRADQGGLRPADAHAAAHGPPEQHPGSHAATHPEAGPHAPAHAVGRRPEQAGSRGGLSRGGHAGARTAPARGRVRPVVRRRTHLGDPGGGDGSARGGPGWDPRCRGHAPRGCAAGHRGRQAAADPLRVSPVPSGHRRGRRWRGAARGPGRTPGDRGRRRQRRGAPGGARRRGLGPDHRRRRGRAAARRVRRMARAVPCRPGGDDPGAQPGPPGHRPGERHHRARRAVLRRRRPRDLAGAGGSVAGRPGGVPHRHHRGAASARRPSHRRGPLRGGSGRRPAGQRRHPGRLGERRGRSPAVGRQPG